MVPPRSERRQRNTQTNDRDNTDFIYVSTKLYRCCPKCFRNHINPVLEMVTNKIAQAYPRVQEEEIINLTNEITRLTLLLNTIYPEAEKEGYDDAINGLKGLIRVRLSYYASLYPNANLAIDDQLVDEIHRQVC